MTTVQADASFLKLLRSHRIAAEANDSNGMKLIIDSTSSAALLSYVQFVFGRQAMISRIPLSELEVLLENTVGESGTVSGKVDRAHSSEPAVDSRVVQMVDGLIRSAIASRASDIHFEPGEYSLACRIRIDGMLVEKQLIDRSQVPEVLSRLKIMAGLDIAEKRRPQDGRIRFPFEDRQVDIRVSVIPTEFGEKAVLRLLDKAQLRLDLDGLGFTAGQLEIFTERVSVANGIVLVTGPTGSGKTTTLYATLCRLKRPQVNISTVEDPIEYNLPGINQTQVKPEIGLTFSAMLRALLRQDPNIIMVGEIRDSETLEIALRASMTGHLVLSTVHTNSAVATVTRLLDMGAEPFLLSSALRLIVAQRLIRLNCQHCLTELSDPLEATVAMRLNYALTGTERKSTGCERCSQTGFAGRQAIYELLPISEPVKELIQLRATETQFSALMLSHGLGTLFEAGHHLIRRGLTTPSEVLREINC